MMTYFFRAVVTSSLLNAVAQGAVSFPEKHNWEPLTSTDILAENLTIGWGLKLNADRVLEVDELFDPASASFRKFLTKEEVRSKAIDGLETCVEVLSNVTKGLSAGGGVTLSKLSVEPYYEISGTVEAILGLFVPNKLNFSKYSHPRRNDTIIRGVQTNDTEEADVVDWILDTDLRECTGVISHFADFPLNRGFRPSLVQPDYQLNQSCEPTGNDNPSSAITPEVLYDMYAVPNSAVEGASALGAAQAVFEANTLDVSQNDLTCFQNTFSIDSSSIDGADNLDVSICSSSCYEPNLDVQYLSGMNQAADISYLAYANFGDMLVALQNVPDSDLPTVVSISYGEGESRLMKNSMIQWCQEFGLLSARGVTFFASSGDDGATNGPREPDTCGSGYKVNFPASCPYVTAVGATTGYSGGSEVVASASNSAITTGGGFSAIFTESAGFNLTFQKTHVDAYLSSTAIASSMAGYPSSGSRGLPDISAAGTNYIILVDEKATGVDGTSCSSPVMAGITSRIMLENATRFGCINHILYANEEAFFDVTSGQNSGNENLEYCPSGSDSSSYMGFAATAGWDPASGLGTLGTRPVGSYEQYAAALKQEPYTPPSDGTSSSFLHRTRFCPALISLATFVYTFMMMCL